MRSKRHIVLYTLASVAVIVGVFLVYPRLSYRIAPSKNSVSLSTAEMSFEIVKSSPDKEKGLGGRESIQENYGMLFVFDSPDEYGFWMKGMLVPIDIIWLSDKGEVISIDEKVTPESYPEVFYPTSPARFVLETKAGEAQRKGWSVGDVIPLPKGL